MASNVTGQLCQPKQTVSVRTITFNLMICDLIFDVFNRHVKVDIIPTEFSENFDEINRDSFMCSDIFRD